MKTMKYLMLTLIGVFALTVSCSDDKELVPAWETAINGQGLITSTAQDFKSGNPAIVVDFSLKWISVDSKATVTKMEAFVSWKESYIDSDGNPAVADHGKKQIATIEGGAVPENRGTTTFSLSQPDMFALYNGQTYDYKDGTDGNAIDIFSSTINSGRDAAVHFVSEDKFSVTWQFTGSDGRVFKAWSPSVCTEYPGSNCQVDFGVVCAPAVEVPGGDWKIDMVDTYGDGWQGGYVGVIVDGVETAQVSLYSQYDPGGVPIGAGSQTITVPASATSLHFEWNDDSYNSECQFKITSPKGNVVADVKEVSAGEIKLNLCKE
ncbi:MAG: hypothetical protein WAU36_10820 [Cyclobacteriaceae bacterium]